MRLDVQMQRVVTSQKVLKRIVQPGLANAKKVEPVAAAGTDTIPKANA